MDDNKQIGIDIKIEPEKFAATATDANTVANKALFESQLIAENLNVATEELEVSRMAELKVVRESAEETIRLSEEQSNGIEGDEGKDQSLQ